MIYCEAILPQSGLGNRLFPWARCRLFSSLHRIPMLSPQWAQIRLGPLLRGEGAGRLYWNLFQVREGDPAGIRKWLIRHSSPVLPEPEKVGEGFRRGETRGVYRFRDVKDHFQQLNGHEQLLLKELALATLPRWAVGAQRLGTIPIGIHVRRRDFRPATSEQDFYMSGNLRTPLDWFIETLRAIRELAGRDAPALVFSDGERHELEPLLRQPNTAFVTAGSAIGDLLALSNAKVLIASGGSTFSAWASFLGQMPTVSHPGQPMAWYRLVNGRGRYVGEFDPGRAAPAAFAEQVAQLLPGTGI